MMNSPSQFHESNPLNGNHSSTSLQSSYSLPFQNSPSLSRNSYNSTTDSVHPTLSTGSLNIQSKEFYPSSYSNLNHSGSFNSDCISQLSGEGFSSSYREGPPGANLFVYHLPQQVNDDDLMTLFMPFGQIISANVYVDKNTGESKGFGFVSYANCENAERAIYMMNGFQIENKRLKVQHKKQKWRG